MDRYEAAIAPWTKGRNLDWEIQVEVADVSKTCIHGQTATNISTLAV